MTDRVFNVLFLCPGNSARLILAESALNKLGEGRFRGYSVGRNPKGAVNPDALRLLERIGYPTEDLRSKSWEELSAPGAPVMDFFVTICDDAEGESCPVWLGHPVTPLRHRRSKPCRGPPYRVRTRLRHGAALSREPHKPVSRAALRPAQCNGPEGARPRDRSGRVREPSARGCRVIDNAAALNPSNAT